MLWSISVCLCIAWERTCYLCTLCTYSSGCLQLQITSRETGLANNQQCLRFLLPHWVSIRFLLSRSSFCSISNRRMPKLIALLHTYIQHERVRKAKRKLETNAREREKEKITTCTSIVIANRPFFSLSLSSTLCPCLLLFSSLFRWMFRSNGKLWTNEAFMDEQTAGRERAKEREWKVHTKMARERIFAVMQQQCSAKSTTITLHMCVSVCVCNNW